MYFYELNLHQISSFFLGYLFEAGIPFSFPCTISSPYFHNLPYSAKTLDKALFLLYNITVQSRNSYARKVEDGKNCILFIC
jgi:hypothetical protein